jgi:2'-5' RNA ligase|tara:strand:- start:124 stop:663 length:540 start_codon:yes stop_codon:yes gene_type:complete
MRLFIAVSFTPEVCEKIYQRGQRYALMPWSTNLRWLSPTNYHMTLAFLDEYDLEQAEHHMTDLANRLESFKAFNMEQNGFRFLPSESRARAFAMTFSQNPAMTALVTELNKCLPAAYKQPLSRFLPHVTLGRFRQGTQGEAIPFTQDAIPIKIRQISLYRSILGAKSARYESLGYIDLA